MKANATALVSDRASMLKLSLRPWTAVITAIALAAGVGSLPAQTATGADDEEIAPDVNALKARAESGSAKAQTQLADMFAGSGDFTNAVVWYRKASEQGDVPAQLTLATLLVTGQGAAKNPQEAAKWLRAAADRIEGKPVTNVVARALTNAPAPLPTNAIVITKSNAAPRTNATATAAMTNTPVLATNLSRVQRADSLHAVEPVLQELQPVLRPPEVR